ncbi:MAG: MgtC/SapB family protein, partial [Ruthenibacterium sp.]
AMAAMTGQYIFEATGSGDPQRIAAQVISGIGFIGAGTIMTTGYHRVKGLTTAAGLWVSACLGLAVGVGFYVGVIAMLIITLSAMMIGEKIQTGFLAKGRRLRLYILFEDSCYFKPCLLFVQHNQIIISDFEQLSEIGKSLSITFLLKVNNPRMPHKAVMDMITTYDGVAFVEEI